MRIRHSLLTSMVLITLLTLSGLARAVELHTLINAHCQAVSGVVVAVDEDSVLLIDMAGEAKSWRREDIQSVVLHRAVDNPIGRIAIDDRLHQHLFNVHLVDADGAAFTGWPVGFIEELVVFYDLYGRTHVLALEDIDSMLHPSKIAVVYPEHAALSLHFPQGYVACENLASESGVAPSRIIGDRVKVGDYFDTFTARYLELESFRERTFLYAKPFLFDERTRLGFLYMARRRPPVPVYIHWATGRPFGFQSFLLVGGAPVPWLPSLEPQVVLWSDLKSHIFHASFVANPFAIPAGTPTILDGVLEPRTREGPHSEQSFNYLILMGVDFGPWSASLGTYYPTRYFLSEEWEREATASRSGLALRARATFDWLAFRALYFRNRQDKGSSEGLHPEPQPNVGYRLSEDTLRAGVSVEAFETEGSLDAIGTRGSYREGLVRSFDYRHYSLGATLSREFGHYVRMNVHVNYHIERDAAVGEQLGRKAKTWTEFDYGGAFEFQF